MITSEQLNIVLAAGGNPTGIVCYPDASHRAEYAETAKEFMAKNSSMEQFGFLEGEGKFHFQMSGGEFCGNAARAAALLISERTGRREGEFTMSGFDGIVSYSVDDAEVECRFPGLQMQVKPVRVLDLEARLVDMGGIVHVVLPYATNFDPTPDTYRSLHRAITKSLGLENKPAVGVIWRERSADGSIAIHPVVWVRDINSFFYETACGSGTLATLVTSGSDEAKIFQPSGQSIGAKKVGNTFVLRSNMEIQGRS